MLNGKWQMVRLAIQDAFFSILLTLELSVTGDPAAPGKVRGNPSIMFEFDRWLKRFIRGAIHTWRGFSSLGRCSSSR